MVTNEILANEISVALSGEALEMLHTLPDPVKMYVLKLAWAYYARRFNIEEHFNDTAFNPLATQPRTAQLLSEYKTSQDLGNNNRLPHLERDFNNPHISVLGEVAQGSHLQREVYDLNDYTQAESATQQLYGTSISYNHITPQHTGMAGPKAMPYQSMFAGRPQNFEFSAGEFNMGMPADPAEY